MEKLKKRWNIKSNVQLFVIVCVFAITGTSAARLSKFLMALLNLERENLGFLVYYIFLLVLVLPIYPFILMGFGWIFGQSQFFFPFAKRLIYQLSFKLLFKESAKRFNK